MKPLTFTASALALGSMTLGLEACSQSSSTVTLVPQAQRSASVIRRSLPEVGGGILYVSDAGASEVSYYDWPRLGSAIGQLTGFNRYQQQLCNDGRNVYLANQVAMNVLVYAVGASSPSKTLADPGGYPEDCAFDSTTEDLAVTNTKSASYGPGNVVVYKNAQGTPREYAAEQLVYPFEAEYDDRGNLFIDGENAQFNPVLAELPVGAKQIKMICPNIFEKGQFGGIAWDGKFIVLGATGGVRRIRGCKTVDFIPLAGVANIIQFAINGKRLTAVDAGAATVDLYNYPKGGSPNQTLSGFLSPIGLTIVKSRLSNAPHP